METFNGFHNYLNILPKLSIRVSNNFRKTVADKNINLYKEICIILSKKLFSFGFYRPRRAISVSFVSVVNDTITTVRASYQFSNEMS